MILFNDEQSINPIKFHNINIIHFHDQTNHKRVQIDVQINLLNLI